MTIGENVKYWREKNKMTQRELAGALFVSYGLIAQIEQGIKNPSVDFAERLAQRLGCTRDDILCEQGRSRSAAV